MSMLLSVLLSIWSLSTFSVFTATDDTDHYANGVVLTAYHQQLYCMWQSSSFRKLAAYSTDQGETWTAPVTTDYLDGRTKQCAGNLPDGTAFMVSCPSGSKDRWPLVLQLSSDGINFGRTIVLRTKDDLPPRRYEGKYKTLGYNYPKAFYHDGCLYIGYSVNKEDVAVTVVNLY